MPEKRPTRAKRTKGPKRGKRRKTAAPRITLAFIRWFDASYQRGECTLDEFVPRVYLDTAGLLVREDAESVSVAMDYYAEDRTWRYVQHIPRVNILRMRRVTL